MDRPFSAYQGDEPFVFVCYSHADAAVVYPEIGWLNEQAVNVWYDEGISAGRNWRAQIGDSLLNAIAVVFYISENSLTSDHCNREINLALDEGLTIVPIYLEDVELTSDLKVGLSRVQALHQGQEENYQQHLLEAVGYTAARQTLAEPVIQSAVLKRHNSIAVLPFVNMSSDPEQEYFSDGITEEILNSLAGVKELKVAGRTSSFAFKGQNDDLRRIGDTLGVEHILEGSVRKSGKTIRIKAELIQVEDGFHLWSETYDRELTDVFAIQDEIAAEILRQLKAELLDEKLTTRETQATDPVVYQDFLLAKQLIYRRTRPDIESAVELLDKAILLDPTFAPTYAQRGIATLLLSSPYSKTPAAISHSKGKRFIDMALKLDPELPEAWAGLGLYHRGRFDYLASINALKKSLMLNPNDINASFWLADSFGSAGNEVGRLSIIEDIAERDPLYPPLLGSAVKSFLGFGHYEKAQQFIDRVRRFDPANTKLLVAEANLHFRQKDYAEGLRKAAKAYQSMPTEPSPGVYSFGLAVTMQAEKLVDECIGDDLRIDTLEMLGRHEEAYKLADELAEDGDPNKLFWLLNVRGHYHDTVAYLDKGWPSLATFATDSHNDLILDYGVDVFLNLALAFRETGDKARLSESLSLIENGLAFLSSEGSFCKGELLVMEASYLALIGESDQAVTKLEAAYLLDADPYERIAKSIPVLGFIEDDPRFKSLESTLIKKMNEERGKLGLSPRDPYAEFWQ